MNEFQIMSNDDEPGIKDEEKICANILDLKIEKDFWLIHDANGKLWKYEPKTADKTLVLKTNSGKLLDMAFSKSEDAYTF